MCSIFAFITAHVDVEGQGEILRITATPTTGQRQVVFDPRSKLITDEHYLSLPTPFVVQRTGAQPRRVALTFDDGPDRVWTPQILSILEQYHVPATFFVIGENAVANRGLLEREVHDGYDIGNHTYTHPKLAQESKTGVSLELNFTRRLLRRIRAIDPPVPRALFRGRRADHARRTSNYLIGMPSTPRSTPIGRNFSLSSISPANSFLSNSSGSKSTPIGLTSKSLLNIYLVASSILA
jgi:hypothetical protein